MTPQERLEQSILEAAQRNAYRDHEAWEWQIDFSNQKFQMPLGAVMQAVNALVERGELEQRVWSSGEVVYGLPEAAV